MVAEECSEACSEEGLKPPPVLVSPCLAVADGCSKLSCAEIAAKGFCECPGCASMVAEECSEACLEISLKLQATAQAGDTKTKSVAKAEDTKKKSVAKAEDTKKKSVAFICPDADVCSTLSCFEIAEGGLCQCPGCEGMVKEECSAACSEEGLEPPPVLVSPCLAVADGCSKLSCAEIAAKGFCQCPGCEGMVKEKCSAACS